MKLSFKLNFGLTGSHDSFNQQCEHERCDEQPLPLPRAGLPRAVRLQHVVEESVRGTVEYPLYLSVVEGGALEWQAGFASLNPMRTLTPAALGLTPGVARRMATTEA